RPVSRAVALVPDWLDNLAALSWRVLAIVAFVVVLWYLLNSIWTATASIIVAIVVAAVFAPFALRLRDKGRSRGSAALIVWVVAVFVIGGVLLLLALAFLPYVVDLLFMLKAGTEAFQAEAASLQLPAWISSAIENTVEASGGIGGDFVAGIVGSVASAVTILILATFLLYFFLRDGDKAWMWFFQSLGQDKMEEITTAGDDALARVGGYLRGTTVLAAVAALTNYAFMLILGVPLALPLAVLTFVATYIPYFGGILTTIIVLLVTLGALGTGPAFVMLVLLSLRTFIVSTFLRPTVYGRTVSLHPALVLIVLPAGLQLGGMIGLFAAVPVTAVIIAVAQSAIDIFEPDPAPELPGLVPAWLDRAAQWSWRALVAIAVVVLLVLMIRAVPLVLIPIILALIFAATLQPVVDWLIRRGHARGRSVAMAVVGATVAIVGVLVVSMVSLYDQMSELGETTMTGIRSIDDSAGGHMELAVDAVWVGVGFATGNVLALTQSLAAAGTVILLAVLLTFYFLRDGAGLWARLMAHTHGEAGRELTAAGSRAYGVLGGYMTGTAAISFVGAGSQWVIMVVLGLPLALPVFVLSFFGGFIPYIGSFLTTVLAFLIAVAVGEPIDILIMAIWTVVFNLVQGNIVAPLVYGRTTNIHPAIVLVSIPAASAIAGILGMFLVVPAIGVVAATWRTVLSVMGSDDEPVEPDAGGDDGGPADDAPPDATAPATT
ncbi:MAG: AI-2E family transporter, partial [Chloroflexota bacterium]|nr:AI-2E family transporter [Chloroflexota bacterium]